MCLHPTTVCGTPLSCPSGNRGDHSDAPRGSGRAAGVSSQVSTRQRWARGLSGRCANLGKALSIPVQEHAWGAGGPGRALESCSGNSMRCCWEPAWPEDSNPNVSPQLYLICRDTGEENCFAVEFLLYLALPFYFRSPHCQRTPILLFAN